MAKQVDSDALQYLIQKIKTALAGIESRLSSVFNIKGSCTFANLPSEHLTVGDAYNITNSFTLNGTSYPAGTIVYWDGSNWKVFTASSGGSAPIDAYTKAEADGLFQPLGSYVKTISVNSGAKQSIDLTGNIDLNLTSLSSDSRLTADMVDYLTSKLTYNYGYSCSIAASPTSLSLPSETTQITFTASFSVTKSNDTGNKPINLSSVTSSTSGWTKSGNTYVKTVIVDPTATSASSGSITATVTNSDNQSGTATGNSKNVNFSKPWFVFEDASGTLADPAQVVVDLISGTRSNLKTGRAAIDVSNTAVTMTKDYLWFAIPNTRTMGDANNIAGLSALESSTAKYTPSATGLGTYSIYRWGERLQAGEFLFNLKIN